MSITPLACDLLEENFAGEWDPDLADSSSGGWEEVEETGLRDAPQALGHFRWGGGCPGIMET